jgi:hypothetical protein
MFAPTTVSTLTFPCKDCHQPVSDAETNAYRLIAGVLYGWCNECFNKQQRFLRLTVKSRDNLPSVPSGEPLKVRNAPMPGSPKASG